MNADDSKAIARNQRHPLLWMCRRILLSFELLRPAWRGSFVGSLVGNAGELSVKGECTMRAAFKASDDEDPVSWQKSKWRYFLLMGFDAEVS